MDMCRNEKSMICDADKFAAQGYLSHHFKFWVSRISTKRFMQDSIKEAQIFNSSQLFKTAWKSWLSRFEDSFDQNRKLEIVSCILTRLQGIAGMSCYEVD